eukprot:1074195-Amphidinium_carterae.1
MSCSESTGSENTESEPDRYAAEECKSNRGIALAAVQKNGRALSHVAEECKRDRDVVLAAVKKT